MNKSDKIDNFLAELKRQDINSLNSKIEGPISDVLEHFAISCKKCESAKIFVSWERGIDYGGQTGYADGQKLFKCLDCGNSVSFWS